MEPFLESAARQLAEAGVESPELNAELLLEHVTGIPRLRRRILQPPPPDAPQLARFHDLLRQRASRIPLQHLVGHVDFLDLRLAVTPAVLIPRPETEQLVLLALERLAGIPSPRVADLGTGSGCIALAIARQRPDARVDAFDLSDGALDVARANAMSNGLGDRVRFHSADAFGSSPAAPVSLPGAAEGFDLIATNPPYIPDSEIAALEPEVRDHDPGLALAGGPDGLAPYRHLAAHASGWLRPGGWLLAEFGKGQAGDLGRLFSNGRWSEISFAKDLSGLERILIVRASRGGRPEAQAGP